MDQMYMQVEDIMAAVKSYTTERYSKHIAYTLSVTEELPNGPRVFAY